MKRKSYFIEALESDNEIFQKRVKENILQANSSKMHRNTIWYRSLQAAEKTCLKDDKIKKCSKRNEIRILSDSAAVLKALMNTTTASGLILQCHQGLQKLAQTHKVHYKFEDGKEMVEEYNVDTHVMLRRAWKVKGKLGGEGKWDVEVGDAIPDATPNTDALDIMESKDQPQLTRRNTRINLEWRIRNLPYPIETYSVSANTDEKCIIIRTTNKKYYKRLQVPELERLNIPLQQSNIQCSHQYNTLIITYKKPQQLLDMEKEWYEELKNVKAVKDIPNECKAQ